MRVSVFSAAFLAMLLGSVCGCHREVPPSAPHPVTEFAGPPDQPFIIVWETDGTRGSVENVSYYRPTQMIPGRYVPALGLEAPGLLLRIRCPDGNPEPKMCRIGPVVGFPSPSFLPEQTKFVPRDSLTWLPSTDLLGLPVSQGGRPPAPPHVQGLVSTYSFSDWLPATTIDWEWGSRESDPPAAWDKAGAQQAALLRGKQRYYRWPLVTVVEQDRDTHREVTAREWRSRFPARYLRHDGATGLRIDCRARRCRLYRLDTGDEDGGRLIATLPRTALTWLPPTDLLGVPGSRAPDLHDGERRWGTTP